jgi:hypothetical protein
MWFGEPWPSGVCYDEDGRLREEYRVDFPAGKSCMWCEELFTEDDSGSLIPAVRSGGMTMEHIHKECGLRMTLGCVAHLEGRCRCRGGPDYEEPGLTSRQDAQMTWDWVMAHRSWR